MSKARLVITAVTVEKRPVSEVAKSYGVARSRVYTLLDRYQAEGEGAFEPRSRRPKTSPSAISDDAADLIVRLRKDLAGQPGESVESVERVMRAGGSAAGQCLAGRPGLAGGVLERQNRRLLQKVVGNRRRCRSGRLLVGLGVG
jgi:hypothetical protein